MLRKVGTLMGVGIFPLERNTFLSTMATALQLISILLAVVAIVSLVDGTFARRRVKIAPTAGDDLPASILAAMNQVGIIFFQVLLENVCSYLAPVR